MLKQFDFNSEPMAITYIKQQLSGGDAFASSLLHLPFENHRITSYLPAELSSEVVREFGLSIFLRSGLEMKDEVELKFVDLISSFLSNSNRRCVVFESFWRTDDLGLATEEIPYFICEKSIYYCLQFQDLTHIRKALQSARQYPFIGALITLPKTAPEIKSHQTVISDILELLAVNANGVLVGAYDGEGFLAWQKH